MIKTVLKIAAFLILILLVGVGLFYYSARQAAIKKSGMIDELAKVPVDSTVDDVMNLAEKLGFNREGKEFAIPDVVEMTDEDLPVKDGQPERHKVGNNSDLSKFKNGTLNFGLSLFLFDRKGCEISFKDGRVKSTRIWWLD